VGEFEEPLFSIAASFARISAKDAIMFSPYMCHVAMFAIHTMRIAILLY